MKPLQCLLVCICLLVCSGAHGQVITTVAGNGSNTYGGDGGNATAAAIGFTGFLSFDHAGNYYISELNNTIRKVSPLGDITTVAGNGTSGFSGDGAPAISAQFNFTGGGGIAFDKVDNIYIADQANNRIRKVDAISGIVSTVVGTGMAGYSGDDGPAIAAQINSPVCVCFDTAYNLYVLDGLNFLIRKITPGGIITTVAGNGIMGFTGDGGPAIAAEISVSGGIHVDNRNNLYLADGIRVRKIELATHIINTIAGNGIYGFSGDGYSATAAQFNSTMDVAIDKVGNIYISDRSNNRIRMVDIAGIIYTVAGNGSGVYSGDNGSATGASLYSPRGMTLDSCGNLYIADNGNNRIRKVAFNPNCWPLTVDDAQQNKPLTIYPNPASSSLHIDNLKAPATYTLYDVTSRVVATSQLTPGSNEINTTHLCPGIYLLHLQYKSGVRDVHKIVKE